ncbi:MAG TPA: ornithine carbamoyltransferase [Thermoproteales archaeon]|nr:ornithine carbamoyltransferase [Thermoproteales archaeon]
MVRHFLKVRDLSPEELFYLLRRAEYYKRKRQNNERLSNELNGKICLLVFEKPSTRTRISLEVAIRELGGQSIYARRDELQLSRGETLKDTAKVLSKYVDCIIARVYSHETLVELAKHADIPIINALSDKHHPLQALADMFTIQEVLGRLRGVELVFIGDGNNNVARSLIEASALLGVNVTIACPPEYRPEKSLLQWARSLADEHGSHVRVVENPIEAVKNADIIYTDVFVSMGFEAEREKRLKILLPKYQVNRELLKEAKKKVYFMHCLPAHRGEEVTSEVIDDPYLSIVYRQAENRLHTAKALLAYLLGGG